MVSLKLFIKLFFNFFTGSTTVPIDCKYLSEIKYKLSLEGLKENQIENFDYIFKNL